MTKTERDPLAQIRSQTAAIIPAYQDEKHIGDIVRRTCERLDHVLVVDDGSSDHTAQRAREAGAEVIVHDQNRGKGEAIKTGLTHWLAVASSSRHAADGLDRQVTWVSLLDSRWSTSSRRDRSIPYGRSFLDAADIFNWQPHEQPRRNAVHPARRESLHERPDQPCV